MIYEFISNFINFQCSDQESSGKKEVWYEEFQTAIFLSHEPSVDVLKAQGWSAPVYYTYRRYSGCRTTARGIVQNEICKHPFVTDFALLYSELMRKLLGKDCALNFNYF